MTDDGKKRGTETDHEQGRKRGKGVQRRMENLACFFRDPIVFASENFFLHFCL